MIINEFINILCIITTFFILIYIIYCGCKKNSEKYKDVVINKIKLGSKISQNSDGIIDTKLSTEIEYPPNEDYYSNPEYSDSEVSITNSISV